MTCSGTRTVKLMPQADCLSGYLPGQRIEGRRVEVVRASSSDALDGSACLRRVFDMDEGLSRLQQVGAAAGGKPLYDFGYLLGALAGADEQRVGRFNDDQVVNT